MHVMVVQHSERMFCVSSVWDWAHVQNLCTRESNIVDSKNVHIVNYTLLQADSYSAIYKSFPHICAKV